MRACVRACVSERERVNGFVVLSIKRQTETDRDRHYSSKPDRQTAGAKADTARHRTEERERER